MAFYDAKEHRKAYGPIYAYALCSAYQHQQVRKHLMVQKHQNCETQKYAVE
jgi:hypothetical protein